MGVDAIAALRGRFGELAECHQDRALCTLGLCVPLEQRDDLAAHGPPVRVVTPHLNRYARREHRTDRRDADAVDTLVAGAADPL